jgi:hypothetical protein
LIVGRRAESPSSLDFPIFKLIFICSLYLSDYQGYEYAEEITEAVRIGSLFTV